ncbi:DsbC family protein [Roseateles violae]|uniref:Thiol:disulfide interchange protein n=1 Tax=Roseateles violae TaxID=3058042 RepID=A0ABT8DS42_9BURK|nr:DsbC family protein [Pelomonas sp. PFR6]MDN3920992.1 DsbC family protein [Pelomonas sp. PFR6]
MNPLRALPVLLLGLASLATQANEAVIRKNLADRLAGAPKIDEVRPSPITGLWEIRIGNEIRYTDPAGNYLIEGDLIDLKTRRNLTEERVEKLNSVDFATLPLKDAIVWKNGKGTRRIAVFADPNCGYCKRFEKALQGVKDITVYTFLIPILGGDSPDKARAIWCAKEPQAAWQAWMLEGKAPVKPMGACDDAVLERNLALSRKIHVTGTPAILFEDSSRAPGALSAEQLERRLQGIKS